MPTAPHVHHLPKEPQQLHMAEGLLGRQDVSGLITLAKRFSLVPRWEPNQTLGIAVDKTDLDMDSAQGSFLCQGEDSQRESASSPAQPSLLFRLLLSSRKTVSRACIECLPDRVTGTPSHETHCGPHCDAGRAKSNTHTHTPDP